MICLLLEAVIFNRSSKNFDSCSTVAVEIEVKNYSTPKPAITASRAALALRLYPNLFSHDFDYLQYNLPRTRSSLVECYARSAIYSKLKS